MRSLPLNLITSNKHLLRKTEQLAINHIHNNSIPKLFRTATYNPVTILLFSRGTRSLLRGYQVNQANHGTIVAPTVGFHPRAPKAIMRQDLADLPFAAHQGCL